MSDHKFIPHHLVLALIYDKEYETDIGIFAYVISLPTLNPTHDLDLAQGQLWAHGLLFKPFSFICICDYAIATCRDKTRFEDRSNSPVEMEPFENLTSDHKKIPYCWHVLQGRIVKSFTVQLSLSVLAVKHNMGLFSAFLRPSWQFNTVLRFTGLSFSCCCFFCLGAKMEQICFEAKSFHHVRMLLKAVSHWSRLLLLYFSAA